MTHSTRKNRKQVQEPTWYEIRIEESIDPCWASCLEGMSINQTENGETVLCGPVVDKSALHGMIAMIGELNLTLLSVVKKKKPGVKSRK